MTAERLIVWRHGRTEWNATDRFQGQADIGLDDLGRRQAAAAAAVLAALAPVRIVASDLSRARSTAQALADLVGLPVETDRRLREIDVGSWEGLTPAQLAEREPERAAALKRGENVRRSDTGETVAEVADRAAEALAEIGAAAPDGSTVVVPMHGLSGRVGVFRLAGLPEESWPSFAGLHNCAWVTVGRRGSARTGGRWRILDYNVRVVEPAEDDPS